MDCITPFTTRPVFNCVCVYIYIYTYITLIYLIKKVRFSESYMCYSCSKWAHQVLFYICQLVYDVLCLKFFAFFNGLFGFKMRKASMIWHDIFIKWVRRIVNGSKLEWCFSDLFHKWVDPTWPAYQNFSPRHDPFINFNMVYSIMLHRIVSNVDCSFIIII